MAEPSGRIWFPGNPWPDGHAIKTAELWGIFAGEGRDWAQPGLHLHLRIESEDYDAEMDEAARDAAYEEEDHEIDRGIDRSSWKSHIVWGNYHRCSIETNAGPRLGGDGALFDLNWLAGRQFELDPIDPNAPFIDFDSHAFHCYIQGHDAVAGHDLTFHASATPHHFDIDWTGRVALSYGGDDVYRYDFRAQLRGVLFQGFKSPAAMKAMTTKTGLFSKPKTTHVNLRDSQSLGQRETEIRELAMRHCSIPQDDLVFAGGRHNDRLRFKT